MSYLSNLNMTKKYQPTQREVYAEMWNGVKNSFSKKIGKPLREFGYSAVTVIAGCAFGPYVVPTLARKLRRMDTKSSITQDIGIGVGMAGGIAAFVAQTAIYGYVAGYLKHPEVALVPVATNIASGLYEIGRKMHSDAKQRLLHKHKKKSLETLSSSK